MTQKNKYAWELIHLFKKISPNQRLLKAFLEDLLTPNEYEEIITRWQIVKQLSEGIPQRKIAKNLNVSIAKITRGSKELRDDKGGFSQILKNYI